MPNAKKAMLAKPPPLKCQEKTKQNSVHVIGRHDLPYRLLWRTLGLGGSAWDGSQVEKGIWSPVTFIISLIPFKTLYYRVQENFSWREEGNEPQLKVEIEE